MPDPTNVIDTATHYSWEAGLLAFLIITGIFGCGFLVWKLGWYVIYALCGNTEKGTRGILGDWFEADKRDKEANTTALKLVSERLELQAEVCHAHVDTVKTLGESLSQQIAAAQKAQEAATLAQHAAKHAADQMAEGNKALDAIDKTLRSRAEVLLRTAEGVDQLKACLFGMCDVCQSIVAKEFPSSAGEVSAYLMAIKKKVNDEAKP
jgi:hypothetical protein